MIKSKLFQNKFLYKCPLCGEYREESDFIEEFGMCYECEDVRADHVLGEIEDNINMEVENETI